MKRFISSLGVFALFMSIAPLAEAHSGYSRHQHYSCPYQKSHYTRQYRPTYYRPYQYRRTSYVNPWYRSGYNYNYNWNYRTSYRPQSSSSNTHYHYHY